MDVALLAEPHSGENLGPSTAPPASDTDFSSLPFDRPGGPQATDEELRQQLRTWLMEHEYAPSMHDYAEMLLERRGEEMLEALKAAHAGDSSTALEKLEETFGELDGKPLHFMPTRRSLEAALAFHEQVSEKMGKERYAHLSWSELRERCAEHDLLELAGRAEAAFVKQRALTGDGRYQSLQLPEEVTEWLSSSNGQSKVGPGRRSGVIEDYTRKELAEMLGFQADEAKRLSEADLRNMALMEGVVPPMAGMPSHVELAWRVATERGRTWWPDRRLKEFQRFMRMPYVKLASKAGLGYEVGSRLNSDMVSRQLRERWPLISAGNPSTTALVNSVVGQRAILDGSMAEKRGIKTHWHERDQHQADPRGRQDYISPIELMHGDELNEFVKENGGKEHNFNGIYGHGGAGRGWSQITHADNGTRRVGAGVLAFYRADTGHVHINPTMEKKLRKARRGKATAQEVAEVSSTIAHELLHACSGDVYVRSMEKTNVGREGMVAHTIEEGTVSTLEGWHAEKLARRMGLWNTLEELPRATNYPYQREVMGALSMLASGTFDAEKIRSGGIEDPKQIGRKAMETMSTAHRTQGSRAHQFYIEGIAKRYSISEEKATEVVKEMLSTVPFGNARTWSRQTMDDIRQQLADAGQKALAGTEGN